MIIKVCKGCGKLNNIGPSGWTSGWFEYTCNRCLGLPPGVQHSYPMKIRRKPPEPLKKRNMMALLRESVRVAA